MRDFQFLPNRRLCGSPYELGGVYPAKNPIFKMESDLAIAECVTGASRLRFDRHPIIRSSQPFSATENHADLSRNFE
jgi:hypothetical protein